MSQHDFQDILGKMQRIFDEQVEFLQHEEFYEQMDTWEELTGRWNEAAGRLAAYAAQHSLTPVQQEQVKDLIRSHQERSSLIESELAEMRRTMNQMQQSKRAHRQYEPSYNDSVFYDVRK